MKELLAYRKKMVADYGQKPEDLEMAYRAAESMQNLFGAGTRTIESVLGELLYAEVHIFAPRLQRILEEDRPEFALVEGDIVYDEAPGEKLLEAYQKQRQLEMKWIAGMPADAWSRTARHPWFGVRTFEWWVEKSLLYASMHIEEIWGMVGENNP